MLRRFHEDVQKLRFPTEAQAEFLGMPMNEGLDFGFQVCHPFHGKELLERWVLHGVRDVGQGIVREKLRGF